MRSWRWLGWVLAIAAAAAAETVPAPAELRADVVVWGRTSIARRVPVAAVGTTVPETVSRRKLGQAEGFVWYVTEHYALRTDYDEARAKHLITLMELAWPHYRALWGRDLPELAGQKRMVVTYGKSQESLGQALAADGMTWDYAGGGITVNGVRGVYNWPGGSLTYHQRYLMIHEGVHQYQMCLYGDVCPGPPWFVEGVADFMANVVWDPAHNALTVGCLDKPTINNYWDQATRQYATAPFTVQDVTAGRVSGRAVGFALTAFFLTDPARTVRFRAWSDALLATPPAELKPATYEALMARTWGDAPALEAAFKTFMTQHPSSYHYVDWGWEQDGPAFCSYGFPQHGAFSQTTIQLSPGARPTGDPLQMDFPRWPPPATVEPPRRGVAEPVVAFTVAYQRDPGRGLAGMGLGMDDRSGLRVLLADGKQLRVEGGDLGLTDASLALPAALVAAADADGHAYGVTVKLAAAAVEVTVRAAGTAAVARVALPLDAPQRQRLLERPLAVLSKGARHTITPFLDVPGEPLPATVVGLATAEPTLRVGPAVAAR